MRVLTYRAYDTVDAKSISWTQSVPLRDGTSCSAPVPYGRLSDIVLVKSSSVKPTTTRTPEQGPPDVRMVMLEEQPEGSDRVASVMTRPFTARRLGDPLELPD